MPTRKLPIVLAIALLSIAASNLLAQVSTPGASPPAPGNRITGIETNRDMIAAEAPTDIVVNGTPGANCAVAIDFGDGARSTHVVTSASPFPLRVAHTYPRMADVTVRVTGVAEGGAPPCEGVFDAAVHVSPAGSKIEYITLSTNSCPEGWSLVGQVNPDKSFRCTPVPDASAPTNLIHCTEGMKYFARGGFIGCAHPAGPAPETIAKAPVPAKTGKGPAKATAMSTTKRPSTSAAPAKTSAAAKAPAGKSSAKPKGGAAEGTK